MDITDLWFNVYLYYIGLKIFGFAGYSIDGDIYKGKIKTQFKDVAYLSLWLLFEIYLIYVNVDMNLSLSNTGSFVIDKGSRFVTILGVCNVLFSTVVNFLFRYKIWGIFTQFYSFDQGLKIFSQQMLHRTPIVSCGLFAFDFTLLFTVILIQFDSDQQFKLGNGTATLALTE
ncbi:unnamed protein product [Diamesa serratosioi]